MLATKSFFTKAQHVRDDFLQLLTLMTAAHAIDSRIKLMT
jgi:hypothetical protein